MNSRSAIHMAVRLVAMLAVLAVIGAGCGGSDDSSTSSASSDGDESIEADEETGDDSAATDSAAASGSEADNSAADTSTEAPGRTTGRFFAGETYNDGEFQATYRGLAQLPVGPDIFEGGACYAALFDVTYLDPLDFGSDQFRPSLDAYLDDGTTATNDQTGVGCDATVLEPEGYAWLNDTTITAGETVTGYLTAFHVSSGIVTDIDIITIYGALPTDGGFDPIVVAELRPVN